MYSQSIDKNIPIPKVIYIFWYQGFENAPEIVKRCVGSWKTCNKNWQINLLDKTNITKYVEFDFENKAINNKSIAHKSDLLRLKLLMENGGVWVDATTYCIEPLDNWIYDFSDNGLFFFGKPFQDRLISNWFIAAQKDNYLIKTLTTNY